jgi:hypothetical protein
MEIIMNPRPDLGQLGLSTGKKACRPWPWINLPNSRGEQCDPAK